MIFSFYRHSRIVFFPNIMIVSYQLFFSCSFYSASIMSAVMSTCLHVALRTPKHSLSRVFTIIFMRIGSDFMSSFISNKYADEVDYTHMLTLPESLGCVNHIDLCGYGSRW